MIPHTFAKRRFKGPHWCFHCHHLIRGIGTSALYCELCKINCHTQCGSLLEPNCPGIRAYFYQNNENVESQIELENETNYPFPVNKSDIKNVYDLIEELSRCEKTRVVTATHKEEGIVYAIKIIDKKKITSEDMEQVISVIERIFALDHPNIIRIKEIYDSKTKLYIVVNLAEGGSLYSLLAKKKYSEDEAKKLLRNLIETLVYLHSHNLIFRILTVENILLKSKEDHAEILLADFGMTQTLRENPRNISVIESLVSIPPEVLSISSSFNEKTDMWMFGVLTYILLSGSPPFYDFAPDSLINAITEVDFNYPEDQWKDISDLAIDLIEKILLKDPSKRLSASEVLEHPWFSSISVHPSPAVLQQTNLFRTRTKLVNSNFQTSFYIGEYIEGEDDVDVPDNDDDDEF